MGTSQNRLDESCLAYCRVANGFKVQILADAKQATHGRDLLAGIQWSHDIAKSEVGLKASQRFAVQFRAELRGLGNAGRCFPPSGSELFGMRHTEGEATKEATCLAHALVVGMNLVRKEKDSRRYMGLTAGGCGFDVSERAKSEVIKSEVGSSIGRMNALMK